MKNLRMDAYYYEFTPTGCREIDEILSAVAEAGKGFHSTEYWNDIVYDGKSYIDYIQEAANKAAKEVLGIKLMLSDALSQLLPEETNNGL